ncbi:MAG: hypothetical protein WBE76_00460 [Terracidiphilus sp.]
MEVQLSTEQEAQLARMADETGRSADELARRQWSVTSPKKLNFVRPCKPGWTMQPAATLSPRTRSGRR